MAANQFNIQAIFNGVDKISTPMRKIMNNMAPLTRQFKSVGKAASAFGGNLKRIISPLALVGSVVSVAGITAAVKNVAAYGDTVAKTADRVGFGVENFQKWQYASEQNGITNEEFSKSLSVMNKNMGALKAGTGPLMSALGKVSPALLQQLEAAQSNEEAFEIMTKAIRNVEDPAKKAYLATTFFGKSGEKMITLANQSEESLGDLMTQAEKLGYVLSEDAAREAEAFGDNLNNTKQIMFGLAKTFTSKLLPAINPLLIKFNDWIVANRELISVKIGVFVDRIVAAIHNIDFARILSGISAIVSGFGRFIDFIGGVDKAAIGLVVVMNSGLILSFFKLIGSIGGLLKMIMPFKAIFGGLGNVLLKFASFIIPLLIKGIAALGTAIMTTPVGWILAIVAAVGALGYGAYKLYKNWDKVKGWFAKLWGKIKEIFSGAAGNIGKTLLKFCPAYLIYKNWDKVKGWFKGLWAGAKQSFTDGFNAIKDVITNITFGILKKVFVDWNLLRIFFPNLWGGVIQSFSDAWEFISGIFTNADRVVAGLIEAWDNVGNYFDGLWEGVSDSFSSAWEFIKDGVFKMGQWVLDKSGISTILSAVDKLKGWFYGEDEGISYDTVKYHHDDAQQIPALSGGGTVVSGSLSDAMGICKNETKTDIKVTFDNMPPSASVSTETGGQGIDLGVETGYAMPTALR